VEDESGASLIETAIAVAILAVVAAIALGALMATVRTQTAPLARDQSLTIARNAIVEARAAAAFDANAVQAILSEPGTTWTSGPVRLTSTIEAGALVVSAASGTTTVQMRYPVVRESLPQGAIVDLHGNPIGPGGL
jgi:Tfp pilus assembly protein PilV